MKHCTRCGTDKPRDAFTPAKSRRDGLQAYCKACYAALAAARRAIDPERAKAIDRASTVRRCDTINARRRAQRAANPELTKAQRKASYAKHQQKELVAMRAWKDANRERMREQRSAKYWADQAASRAKQNAYLQANADKARAWRMARIASQMNATPTWAERDEIQAYYTLAKIYEQALGEPFEVDHIVPLRGAIGRKQVVSGLHVGHNLQVLPKSANRKKLNTFWPDMPGHTT